MFFCPFPQPSHFTFRPHNYIFVYIFHIYTPFLLKQNNSFDLKRLQKINDSCRGANSHKTLPGSCSVALELHARFVLNILFLLCIWAGDEKCVNYSHFAEKFITIGKIWNLLLLRLKANSLDLEISLFHLLTYHIQ